MLPPHARQVVSVIWVCKFLGTVWEGCQHLSSSVLWALCVSDSVMSQLQLHMYCVRMKNTSGCDPPMMGPGAQSKTLASFLLPMRSLCGTSCDWLFWGSRDFYKSFHNSILKLLCVFPPSISPDPSVPCSFGLLGSIILVSQINDLPSMPCFCLFWEPKLRSWLFSFESIWFLKYHCPQILP